MELSGLSITPYLAVWAYSGLFGVLLIKTKPWLKNQGSVRKLSKLFSSLARNILSELAYQNHRV